jgi:hypothetical protein
MAVTRILKGQFDSSSNGRAELKRRAWINDAARAADHASDFSQRIREGRSQ